MNAILSEKGQITIPKCLREDLGLVPGTVLDFTEENGRLVARRIEEDAPIGKWRGKGRLPKGGPIEVYIRKTRGGQ